MKTWRSFGLALLAGGGLTSALWAQAGIPAAPAVPVAPAVAGAPVAAPAAAPQANLWSFLCPDPAKMAACKAKFCASGIGQLMSNMMAPAAAFTGGILGNCCPPNAPDPAGLAAPADTPGGAAARIKADEMAAKKRREDVRYLGTVDCHHWPEAQLALINALRADRNECVRLEAALSLGRGCCCTRKTVVALSISAAGSDRDGNPSENCERVREAAAASLAHCLSCLADPTPLTIEPGKTGGQGIEKPPVVPKRGEAPPLPGMTYYERVDQLPMAEVVSVARRVLAKANKESKAGASNDVAHSGAFNIVASAVAMNGHKESPYRLEAVPSTGSTQVAASDPLAVVIARQFAPAPLADGQSEASKFKTPSLFQRRSQEEMVVVTTTPSVQPGPSTIISTTPAVVTTQTLPAQAPVVKMPAPPTTSKTTTPYVQTSYLANTSTPSASSPAPAQYPRYVADLMTTVKTGRSCEESLAAVFSLANSEWRTHPEVVLTLSNAAKQNPMLPVRITAIRCLAGMRINSPVVRSTLQALKNDSDATVRTEAEQALNSLVFYTPPQNGSVVR